VSHVRRALAHRSGAAFRPCASRYSHEIVSGVRGMVTEAARGLC